MKFHIKYIFKLFLILSNYIFIQDINSAIETKDSEQKKSVQESISTTNIGTTNTESPEQLPEVDISLKEEQVITILPLKAPEGVILGSLTLSIPVIGDIELNPDTDKKTGEPILRASLADKNKKLNLGPLTIDQGEIVMRQGNKITIEAQTTLFGKAARLSLQDLTRTHKLESHQAETEAEEHPKKVSKWQIGRVHLRLKFIDKPSFSILPDQKVILNSANLILERNKPINLYSNIKLFGQPVKLSFDYKSAVLAIGFAMKKALSLSSLVKPLSGTEFKDITFKNINFRTSIIFSKSNNAEAPDTTFSGLVDFSSLFTMSAKQKEEQKKEEAAEQASTEAVEYQAGQTTEKTTQEITKKSKISQTTKEERVEPATTQNTEIITPEGPINAHSKKAFIYFKSLINSKYVTPAERTDDGQVIDESKSGEAPPVEEEQPKDTKTTSATAETDNLDTIDRPVNNLQFSARYNKKDGLHFEALVDNLELPVIERVRNAKFIFDYKKKIIDEEKKSFVKLLLSGDGEVSLPEVGTLKYTLASAYSKKGFSLEATLNNEIKFKGVTLSKAHLKVKPKRKILLISGTTNIHNFDLIANLEIQPDAEQKGKSKINFSAQVQKDSFKPFENTGIGSIKNFTVNNLKANLLLAKGSSGQAELSLTGKSNILRVDTDVAVKFVKNQEGQSGAYLKAALPENWKLSDSISSVGRPFDDISFEQAYFIANSINNYVDPEDNIKVSTGLSLTAISPLSGALEPVKILLGNKLDKAKLYGVMSTNPRNIVLGAELSEGSGAIAMKTDRVTFGPMSLEISGEPSLDILSKIFFHPSSQDLPLEFTGRVKLRPIDAVFSATMLGMWKNPFGLNGLAIGDLALQLGIIYAKFAASGLPSKIGFAGKIDIGQGDRKLEVAAQFDESFRDMALLGKLNYFSLLDLVRFFAYPIGARIPSEAIPNIALRNLEFKFAAQDVKIGEITIPQGITVKGELEIIKSKAVIDCNISPSGIKALGYTTPIHLGPLHITDSDRGKSPSGGPMVKLELDAVNQEFILTGKIDLESIFSVENYVRIAKSGITFNFDADIANGMFEAHIQAESTGPINNPDIKLIMDFRQRFIDYIIEEVNKGLQIAQDEIRNKINAAQDQVNTINSAIAKSDEDLESARKAVARAREQINSIDDQIEKVDKGIETARNEIAKARERVNSINSAIEESNRKIQDAEEIVQNSQNNLNSINDAISNWRDKVDSAVDRVESLKREINDTKSELENWRNAWKAPYLSAKLAGLYTAYLVARGALEAGKYAGIGVLRASQAAARTALFAAKGLLTGLREAAKGTLIGARETAQETLRKTQEALRVVALPAKAALIASKQATKAILTAAEFAVHDVARNVSRQTLIASRTTANGVLEGAKQSGVAVLEGGKWIVKGILGSIQIRHAHFEGSLSGIKNGRLPDIEFDVSILGHERKLVFTFDFTKPAESAISIARALVNLVKP